MVNNALRLNLLGCLTIMAIVSSVSCLARAQPDEIVTIYSSDRNSGAEDRLASLADFAAWKLGSTTLKEIALYRAESYDISSGGFQGKVQGYSVWVSLFDVLDIRPLLGRAFLPEEKQPSQSHVVILSYELWQTAFDKDPAILGKAISVAGEKSTVVGIMPKSMDAIGPGRIMTPFVPGYFAGASHDREFHVIARLKAGLKLADAQADLERLDQKRHRDEPKYDSAWKARVAPMRQL